MIFLLCFISGIFEGYMDVLQFHWQKFKYKHKNCNSWYWCPQLSWKNKYKDNNPTKGEKFLFSTTILVSLTDAWHLMKLLRNWSLFGAMFFMSEFHIVLVVLGMYVVNRLGFSFIYNVIYR